jgi:hypothetical protein
VEQWCRGTEGGWKSMDCKFESLGGHTFDVTCSVLSPPPPSNILVNIGYKSQKTLSP